MLWYSIQSKPTRPVFRSSEKPLLKNPFPESPFNKCLEIEVYLHYQPHLHCWKARLIELFRCLRFHRQVVWKALKNVLLVVLPALVFGIGSLLLSGGIYCRAVNISWACGILDWIRIGFDPALAAFNWVLEVLSLPLPQHDHDQGHINDLMALSRFWWLQFSATTIALTLIALSLSFQKRLTTVRLYFLTNNEPFPILESGDLRRCSLGTRSVIAIRLLHPRLSDRAKRYLQDDGVHVVLGSRPHLAIDETQKMSKEKRKALDIRSDFGPLVRLALAFSLRPSVATRPLTENSEPANGEQKPESISKSFRFSYKFHLPQLVAYFLLLALSITTIVARPFGDFGNTQTVVLLATLGFFWAFWSVELHRRETNELRTWEALNTVKPFSSSPIYTLAFSRDFRPFWVELADSDFRTAVADYGLDKQNLLSIAIGLYLALFFAMLELTK